MTDAEHERCLRVLAAVHALHNWRHCATNAGIMRDEWCVQVVADVTLSTFDMDGLTRLVLAAHREHCRVDISPHGFRWLRIRVQPRTERGGQTGRHPGLRELRDRITAELHRKRREP